MSNSRNLNIILELKQHQIELLMNWAHVLKQQSQLNYRCYIILNIYKFLSLTNFGYYYECNS